MWMSERAIILVGLITEVLSGILPSSRSKHDLRAHLEMDFIIPDVISVAPEDAVEVRYLGGLMVNLGKILYPSQVQFMPYSVDWPTEKDTYYTLIMTDPDYPARKKHKQREYQQWLVGNIPGTGVMKGTTLTGYHPPSPPKGTGLHRYAFVVFKQPHGLINFTERPIPEKQKDYRGRFRTMNFSAKYELGAPIAANFFRAEWTDPEAETTPWHLTTLWFTGTFPPSTKMPRPIDIA